MADKTERERWKWVVWEYNLDIHFEGEICSNDQSDIPSSSNGDEVALLVRQGS